MMKSLLFSTVLLASSAFASEDIRSSMMSNDSREAREAINLCVAKGKEMLPLLQRWTLADSIKLRMRAKDAIGKITGQWGSHTDLVWHTDFESARKEAAEKNKPLMVLQLFGNLNEEFC